MPITLTQQTALITGASRGIGRGIALKLAEQGVKRIAINYKENDAAAEDAARLARSLVRGRPPATAFPRVTPAVPPRRLFGLVVDSRPPPAAA